MAITVLSECGKRGHEQVCFFNYPDVGLKAIVSIHDTTLGPGVGGCRMRAYATEEEALEDVMRLSEGMTYKSALAGLDLGGGKACIIADPRMTTGREALFKKFGECVGTLMGRYVSAEDMGTSVTDMMWMASTTKHVVGKDSNKGGGGDPSPWTAHGVFAAILAACERVYGSRDLTGRRVAVQGVGHVGMYLLRALRNAGATATICDTNDSAVREAATEFQADVVTPDAIYDVPCDIYAPCAVGQTVNPSTLHRLNCRIIAGAANNQLSDPSVYAVLEKRNILYCPDFAINSGGIICVGAELNVGGWKEPWVKEKVDAIYATTCRVLDQAKARGKFTEQVAIELAKERIAAAKSTSTP